MRHEAGERDNESLEIAPGAYAKAVGSRLRAVRTEMHLSLQRVDALSEGEFRTSVLGAYERGDRAISLPRLQRLATLYNVPLERFLPRDGAGERDEAITRVAIRGAGQDRDQDGPRPFANKVTIDLVRLKTIDGPERDVLEPYLAAIQAMRRAFRGSVITIRGEDLRVISCLVGLTPDDMNRRLEELGLRAGPTEHGSSQSRRAS
jgi:transcriptional regulator with XRE-family HTH domain